MQELFARPTGVIRAGKNRDKLINYTVRVMLRLLFNLVDESEVNA
jgi:hypothetical protein